MRFSAKFSRAPVIRDAVSRPPLSDGDGAVAIGGPPPLVVAVGTAVVDTAAPAQACSVARLRAQHELLRFITGAKLESRIGLATSEVRGAPVQESFREDVTETVAGRLAGGALAAQWIAPGPARCRVALWLRGELTVRRDTAPP